MTKSKTTPISKRKFKLYHFPIFPYFLIIDTLKNLKKKRYINGLAMLIITIIFSGMWLGGYTITALAAYQIAKQTAFNKTAINSSLPATTPIVTPSLSPNVQGINTTKTQVVNTDPIINCKFTHLGIIRLRRSVCNKSTECQIGDKWIYYDSISKCKADQNTYYQKQYNAQSGQKDSSFDQAEYKRQLSEVKIDCSLNSPPYSYNFGQLTYDECKQKSDAYFAQKRAELGPAPQPGHLEKALQEMYDLSHPNFTYPQASPIDGTIYIVPTPTPLQVPVGYP